MNSRELAFVTFQTRYSGRISFTNMNLAYESLKDGEIRLLSLTRKGPQPTVSTNVQSNIALSFTKTIIAGTGSIPPFVALSYVWGDPLDKLPFTYSSGTLTVFLSTVATPFEIGLSFLKEAAAHPEAHYEPSLHPHITIKGGLTAYSQILRDSVIAFFATPWWTRTWTVQELVLAKQVDFRCGNQFDFMRNADAFGVRNLLGILAMFRTRNCTDPRDHIFGMLGLDLGDTGVDLRSRLKVDYTASAIQLYEDAASAIIQSSGNLDVLSHVCQYSSIRTKLAGLPSWVPDWSAAVDETFHHYYSERTMRTYFYKVSGDMVPFWDRLGHGRVATNVLTLGKVSAIVPGYPTSTSPTSSQTLLKQWQTFFGVDLITTSLSNNKPSFEEERSKLDQFAFTLSGDLSRNEWNGDANRHIQAFRSWCTWFTDNDPLTLTEDEKRDARLFDDLAKCAGLERRMFRTDKGHVGFGPELPASFHPRSSLDLTRLTRSRDSQQWGLRVS